MVATMNRKVYVNIVSQIFSNAFNELSMCPNGSFPDAAKSAIEFFESDRAEELSDTIDIDINVIRQKARRVYLALEVWPKGSGDKLRENRTSGLYQDYDSVYITPLTKAQEADVLALEMMFKEEEFDYGD